MFISGLAEVIELPGLLITEFELVVLGGECAWLLPYKEHFPTLAHVQNMSTFDHVVSNGDLKLFCPFHCSKRSITFRIITYTLFAAVAFR